MNKNHLKLLPFLSMLLLLLHACSKQGTETVNIPVTPHQQRSPVTKEIKQYFAKLGFDSTKVVEYNEQYLASGDILFEKNNISDQIKADKQTPPTAGRHAHTNNLVTGNNTNIIVSLQDNLIHEARWISALQNAALHINQVTGCRVNIMYALNEPTADIKIYRSADPSYYGMALWPKGNGQPGDRIYVNPDVKNTNGSNRTQSQDILMLVHEIGHCLGLRHADWDNNGEPLSAYDVDGTYGGGNYIPGTPNYDANSVMNYDIGILGRSWTGFSEYDLVGLRYLYPVESNTVFENYIVGSRVIHQSSQRTHTAGAFYYDNQQWRLADANGNILFNFGDNYQVLEWDLILSPGAYQLQCRLINQEAPGVWYTLPLTVQ